MMKPEALKTIEIIVAWIRKYMDFIQKLSEYILNYYRYYTRKKIAHFVDDVM